MKTALRLSFAALAGAVQEQLLTELDAGGGLDAESLARADALIGMRLAPLSAPAG